jgi:uncharacterized membrane protein HdeD (DUF308 family)
MFFSLFFKERKTVMIVNLIYQIEVFLLVIAIFVLLSSILHIISVFRLRQCKIVSSEKGLFAFAISLAYIITILITGFLS